MPAKPVDPVPLPVPSLPLAYPTCAPCHRRPASAMEMVVVLAVSLATGCSSSKGLQHGSAPSDSGATAGTSLDGRTGHDSPGSATGGAGPATTGSGGAAGAGGSDTTGSGGSDTTENGGTGGVRLDAWASENPDVVGLGGASGTHLDGAAAGTGGAGGTHLDGAAAGTGGAGGSKIDGGSGETTPADAAPKSLACGDGILTWPETCDDGNTVSRDGCSSDCQAVENGYTCPVPGKRCWPLCGDGKIVGSESCDDGNTTSWDGCSSTCEVEPGSDCPNPGKACTRSVCGNGKVETGERCDCGVDPAHLPSGCAATNGLFYGDGKGCSATCTLEPICQDSSGKTQACSTACGDGNLDPGEECDDGNQVSGDGCSWKCNVEDGFTCSTTTVLASSTCQSGSGQCLELPVIYRDFQPENAASGGHPDFLFLGTKTGGASAPTTWCIPESSGPAKGKDATARCWGMVGATLSHGKPQPGSTTTCACQFSDLSMGNSSHIQGGYTEAGNDSPLSDGKGGFRSDAILPSGSPAVPIWQGTVPAYQNATSFNQWWNDDSTVNKTFTGVLEMPSIGTNIYQYASKSHLAAGGFFPLDTLNPSQATLCNLMPYWNRSDGSPIWSTCKGDQYLYPPRVVASDCMAGDTVDDGCWVTSVSGAKHDFYFTEEARYDIGYDGSTGISIAVYGGDDVFVFINGVLVLDLGGTHTLLPGKVTVSGDPGNAQVTEGGCVDNAGNIAGASVGSKACASPGSSAPVATTPDDFRTRTVPLGLMTGKVYELAIFGTNRHPPVSDLQITLTGGVARRSECAPRCGDGIAVAGEACDCGDGSGPLPSGCPGPNNDATYGGCATNCQRGPYCGDGIKAPNEQCDLGKQNGDTSLGTDGCTLGCLKPNFCGDSIVDPSRGETCDLGAANGQPGQTCDINCHSAVVPAVSSP